MDILTDAGREVCKFFDPTAIEAVIETDRRALPGTRFAHPHGTQSLPCPEELRDLAGCFFGRKKARLVPIEGIAVPERFQLMILQKRATRSNLDLLTDLARRGIDIPDGLVCAALRGENFLGRFDRGWNCLPGNVHAVIHLEPRLTPGEAGPVFSILAALACVDAINLCLGSERRETDSKRKPLLKWINDVFLGTDKVAGSLTRQTFQTPLITDAFLGIGVNVLTAPTLPPTAFVPAAGCLADLFPERAWAPGTFLAALLDRVDFWYTRLLDDGPAKIVSCYRQRTSFLDRSVQVYEDGFGFGEGGREGRRLLARGVVEGIDDDLSLRIVGCDRPIDRGRLAFEEDCS
jgi:biotin-(acetyl-CoA carboxylase) ligase